MPARVPTDRGTASEGGERGAFVAVVAAGQCDREGQAGGVDEGVVFAAGAAAVDRARIDRVFLLFAPDMRAVDRGAGPDRCARRHAARPVAARAVDPTPGRGPAPQPPPARHPGAVLSCGSRRSQHIRCQHQRNPVQTGPVVQPPAARMSRPSLGDGQQRLDPCPSRPRDRSDRDRGGLQQSARARSNSGERPTALLLNSPPSSSTQDVLPRGRHLEALRERPARREQAAQIARAPLPTR